MKSTRHEPLLAVFFLSHVFVEINVIEDFNLFRILESSQRDYAHESYGLTSTRNSFLTDGDGGDTPITPHSPMTPQANFYSTVSPNKEIVSKTDVTVILS